MYMLCHRTEIINVRGQQQDLCRSIITGVLELLFIGQVDEVIAVAREIDYGTIWLDVLVINRLGAIIVFIGRWIRGVLRLTTLSWSILLFR